MTREFILLPEFEKNWKVYNLKGDDIDERL